MAQQLLSPKKVSEMLDISRASVYKQMAMGHIPYLKIGRSRRIKIQAVNKFIKLLESNMRVAQK